MDVDAAEKLLVDYPKVSLAASCRRAKP